MFPVSTINAVKEEIASKGVCKVSFAAASRVTGVDLTDEKAFSQAVDSTVRKTRWLESAHISWVDEDVYFYGPIVVKSDEQV